MATNFQPIFDYIDKSIEPLSADIQDINSKIDTLINAVDKFTGEVKKFRDDNQISAARLERLEHWGKKVGIKVRVPLEL